MPRRVAPLVHIIAETKIDREGMNAALAGFGVPDWAPDQSGHESRNRGDMSDAEALIEFAGKSCYMSFALETNKNLTKVGTRNNFDYIQDGIIGVQHGSVLEHTTVTFLICDVSRVFTHELVRHRVGTAFSQVSGRYVRTDELTYYLPMVLEKNSLSASFFHKCFATMEVWVRTMEDAFQMKDIKDFGLKKQLTSAFRRLIGNGQGNHIVFTANHNALRHIIELRTAEGAEEEMQIVFNLIYSLLVGRYPAIYADAKLELLYDSSVDLWAITFPPKAKA